MHERDELCIVHILDACGQVSAYAARGSRDRLDTDSMYRDAVVRQLEIIGEAASRLSPEFRLRTPEIPWLDIINMRHRLIRGYSKLDLNLVWTAAQTEVLRLARMLEPWKPRDLQEDQCG